MKIIYKKRLSSPIQQIVPFEDTFSYITKGKLQYIHPDVEILLPFTPKQFTVHNQTFFYLHKEKIFFKHNNEYKKIKIPNKTFRIVSNSNSLLIAEKKIIKMEFRNGQYETVDQIYGPIMHISNLSLYKEKILAISYGDSNIYLFNNKEHLVFNGKSLMTACCLIDDDNFVVSEGNMLYLYNLNKKGPYNTIDIGHEICVIQIGFSGILVGCVDGYCFIISENKVVDEFRVEGVVGDLKVIGDSIVVGSGYEKSIHSINEKVRNYLTIFNK